VGLFNILPIEVWGKKKKMSLPVVLAFPSRQYLPLVPAEKEISAALFLRAGNYF
jgi:hypothetical protein